MDDLAVYEGPLLLVLADEMMYWRKTGVYPSQKRIQKELWKKFGIRRSIRTINRWLAKAESDGLLWRKKRHIKDRLLGWLFRSSLYTITGRGWDRLIKMGKYTWDQFTGLIKEAEATFRKPKKTRKVFRSSGQLTSIGDIYEDIIPDTS